MLYIHPQDRLAFWFPIVLPILMGLVLAFAEFSADLTATAYLMNQGGVKFSDMFKIDVIQLWQALPKNIGSAVFAIDIWALSILFVSREIPRARSIYTIPVLGIFAHFILLLVIVGVSNLANAFDTLASMMDSSESLNEFYAMVARIIVSIVAFASIVVGWAVRRGVWIQHDSILAEQQRVEGRDVHVEMQLGDEHA